MNADYKSVPVASLVEDGEFYVVMAETLPNGAKPAADGNKLTRLVVVHMVSGERVHQKDIYSQYVALPPTGGLFWEYCGRRLLDECVKRRVLSQDQVLGYEKRYQGGDQ